MRSLDPGCETADPGCQSVDPEREIFDPGPKTDDPAGENARRQARLAPLGSEIVELGRKTMDRVTGPKLRHFTDRNRGKRTPQGFYPLPRKIITTPIFMLESAAIKGKVVVAGHPALPTGITSRSSMIAK